MVDEYNRRHRNRQFERAFMYAGLMFSGVFLTLSPSAFIVHKVSLPVQYFWSGGMVLGAAVCCWGAITDRWLGEFSGIFMLIGTLWFYGGMAFLAWRLNSSDYTVLGFSFILVSFGFGLLARWQEVRRVKQQASKDSAKSRE